MGDQGRLTFMSSLKDSSERQPSNLSDFSSHIGKVCNHIGVLGCSKGATVGIGDVERDGLSAEPYSSQTVLVDTVNSGRTWRDTQLQR
jgi:hypothetical protein